MLNGTLPIQDSIQRRLTLCQKSTLSISETASTLPSKPGPTTSASTTATTDPHLSPTSNPGLSRASSSSPRKLGTPEQFALIERFSLNQQVILSRLAEGVTVTEIANLHARSVKTISTQCRRMREVLGDVRGPLSPNELIVVATFWWTQKKARK